jgi:hypothetical protein
MMNDFTSFSFQDYDTDKQFPLLGFGARLPPHGRTNVFVNMSTTNPYCNGIEGVVQAYRLRYTGPVNPK